MASKAIPVATTTVLSPFVELLLLISLLGEIVSIISYHARTLKGPATRTKPACAGLISSFPDSGREAHLEALPPAQDYYDIIERIFFLNGRSRTRQQQAGVQPGHGMS